MKFVKRLLFWSVVFVVAVVAFVAASDNSDEVALVFLEYSTGAWPVSYWMLVAFVLGALFASVINLWTNTSLRLEKRKAHKEVDKVTRSLDKARAEGVVEPVSGH